MIREIPDMPKKILKEMENRLKDISRKKPVEKKR